MADNVVELVVKVTDAASTQIRGISASIDDMGSKVGGLSLKSVAGFGAIAGAITLAEKAFSGFVSESSEIEDATIRLNRLYKAFSDTVGVSRESMQAFADSARQNSRFSDQAITSMQATLLKFGTITGDTFKRAQQAAIDLGSAMGNLEQGAYIVGRALAAPEQSARLLREAGVVLTDEQKKLIKSFQDMNDAAGASNVILTELEKRYRGAAGEDINTFSGAWERLTNSFKQMFESGGLLKSFTDAVNRLNGVLQNTSEQQERLAIQNLKSASTWDKFLDSATGGGGIERALKEREANLAQLVKIREDGEKQMAAADAAAAATATANQSTKGPKFGDLGFDDIYAFLPALDHAIIAMDAMKANAEEYYKVMDKIPDTVAQIGEELDRSSESTGEMNKELSQNADALDAQMKIVFKDMTDASNAQIKMYANMQDIFTNFFENTHEGFRGLLRDFITMIRNMVAEAFSAKLMDALFGTVSPTGQRGGGGFWDSIVGGVMGFFTGGGSPTTGGAAAGGGNIGPGLTLVGEEGPEIVATGPARVFNQRQLAFAGGGGGAPSYSPITNIMMQPKDTDAQTLRQEFYAAIQMNNHRQRDEIFNTMYRNGLGRMR